MFSRLYGTVWQDLYRYAYYYLGNTEDAEDAVQEAALRGFKGLSGLRDHDAFRGWMFHILSVCCKRKVSELIQIRRGKTGNDELETLSEENTDLEVAIMLRERIAGLKPDDRQLVLLSVVGGYKSGEIAEILHLTAGNVRSRLSRILGRLRVELE